MCYTELLNIFIKVLFDILFRLHYFLLYAEIDLA